MGRNGDENKKEAVLDCIAKGYGYSKSVPVLIERGFVDENGSCTVNIGTFHHYRRRFGSKMLITIEATPEEQRWAKEHEDEIISYIRTRMEMEATKN